MPIDRRIIRQHGRERSPPAAPADGPVDDRFERRTQKVLCRSSRGRDTDAPRAGIPTPSESRPASKRNRETQESNADRSLSCKFDYSTRFNYPRPATRSAFFTGDSIDARSWSDSLIGRCCDRTRRILRPLRSHPAEHRAASLWAHKEGHMFVTRQRMICGAVGLFLALVTSAAMMAAMIIAAPLDSTDELDHSKLVIDIQSDAIDSCRQTIDSMRRTIESLRNNK